ncbi:MAG: hypothetical protein ACI814_002808 [Mariniblastus sp.]
MNEFPLSLNSSGQGESKKAFAFCSSAHSRIAAGSKIDPAINDRANGSCHARNTGFCIVKIELFSLYEKAVIG